MDHRAAVLVAATPEAGHTAVPHLRAAAILRLDTIDDNVLLPVSQHTPLTVRRLRKEPPALLKNENEEAARALARPGTAARAGIQESGSQQAGAEATLSSACNNFERAAENRVHRFSRRAFPIPIFFPAVAERDAHCSRQVFLPDPVS